LKVTKFLLYAASIAVIGILAPSIARAQDPLKVDAKHYKLEFENDKVRVLRIHYGPHEKSVMHDHPAGQVIYLTDANTKFSFPDGKTQMTPGKAGQTAWIEGGKHLPENLGDKAFDAILVEIKGAAAKPAAKTAPAKK
jgi:quercetin dioxygenase-like cupin family protein